MNPLKQKLDINNERYRIIVSVKEDYLDGKLSLEEGNRILKENQVLVRLMSLPMQSKVKRCLQG